MKKKNRTQNKKEKEVRNLEGVPHLFLRWKQHYTKMQAYGIPGVCMYSDRNIPEYRIQVLPVVEKVYFTHAVMWKIYKKTIKYIFGLKNIFNMLK